MRITSTTPFVFGCTSNNDSRGSRTSRTPPPSPACVYRSRDSHTSPPHSDALCRGSRAGGTSPPHILKRMPYQDYSCRRRADEAEQEAEYGQTDHQSSSS